MLLEAVLLTALSVPQFNDEVSIKIPEIKIEEKLPEAPTKPTRTPYPTATPHPSKSPKPTETPEPSKTPRPTKTPRPSKTPKPVTAITPKPSTAAVPAGINQQTILIALNNYRQKNNVSILTLDPKLQSFAQKRADDLKAGGKLDNHTGFKDYINNHNGFAELGFNSLAENQSWNYKGTATGLIETLYGKSSGHNKNQLNATYTHVGIGVSGAYTNLVFGGKKR